MRNQTYYYVNGDSFKEQAQQIKFAATELVKQAMDCGYIVEAACQLNCLTLILDYVRQRKLLPEEIWNEWKKEIIADKLKVKELEDSGKLFCYHLGVSQEFASSPLYVHWKHSVSPEINTENIDTTRPYLITDRSGKAYMFEYLIKETGKSFVDISLDEPKVYELISDSVKFAGHPYLPDGWHFDMGVWGIPGIGTEHSAQVLLKKGRIYDFKKLVEVTRTALSITESDQENEICDSRSLCSITEAILQAIAAYYMAWYYLYETEAWTRAYRKAYLNPTYMEEWKSETWDGDLLIEKGRKSYWERLLMLENEEENEEKAKEEYKEYLRSFPMDIETVIQVIEKIWIKEGSLAIEDYGKLLLKGTYLDFWKWLYEETDYRRDEILSQIACYAENDEVRANKERLFDALKKYAAYPVYELERSHFSSLNKPQMSYRHRRRIVAREVEMEKNAYLKELKTYSHSFTKFSIDTESAFLFAQCSKEERNAYLRQIVCDDLSRALVLYQPSQRDMVLGEMSPRIQNMILGDMKDFVKSRQFSLEECVEAEHKIRDCINRSK